MTDRNYVTNKNQTTIFCGLGILFCVTLIPKKGNIND